MAAALYSAALYIEKCLQVNCVVHFNNGIIGIMLILVRWQILEYISRRNVGMNQLDHSFSKLFPKVFRVQTTLVKGQSLHKTRV